MRILVTGTDGYIGCLVADQLLRAGHEVVGVDVGFYDGLLYDGSYRTHETLRKDIRDLQIEDLEGFDAIAHLAELSNDPLGEVVRDVTYEINHRGTVRLAELAKASGIERFVYTSSCSVYGVADGVVDETSQVNPQTAYAECKTYVERDLKKMADDNFSPVFLRNATVYGPTPRIRFDVVLNNLSGLAYTTGKITMLSDGSPWRPLVHVSDAAQAVVRALEAPREAIHGEVFNVGHTDHNWQVKEIAEIVAEAFPGCELEFGPPSGDNRSYKVNFDKIASQLPGYKSQFSAEDGARQLSELFSRINLTEEVFKGRGHIRLKQLEYLMETGQLDERLRFRI